MRGSEVEPGRLVRDVLLRDGSTLRLQTPTAGDFDDVKAFYEDLSPRSRFLRFHGFGRLDTAARAAVAASGVDRFSLIGRHGGRVVAAASYEGLREPGVAEIAFAVADADQRRGIGTRMLEQLAAIGADRGIRRFDALVMAENSLMLGVFNHAGFAVRRQGFGEVTVSLDIAPTKAALERIDERDHFAAVASLRPILGAVFGGRYERRGRSGHSRPRRAGEHHRWGLPRWCDIRQPRGRYCVFRVDRAHPRRAGRCSELVIIVAAGDAVLDRPRRRRRRARGRCSSSRGVPKKRRRTPARARSNFSRSFATGGCGWSGQTLGVSTPPPRSA